MMRLKAQFCHLTCFRSVNFFGEISPSKFFLNLFNQVHRIGIILQYTVLTDPYGIHTYVLGELS